MSNARPTIVIESKFHGPANSGNGGYVSGRMASFIDGAATVRLRVPPPLDVPMEVEQTESRVFLRHQGSVIAEAWPVKLALDVPKPPTADEAEAASREFPGFKSHRFPSCFVCGPQRDDGL